MSKQITVIWYGSTPQTYHNVEDFQRLNEDTIKFKTVDKKGDKVKTQYVTTNFPYIFEETVEHSGKITI
jgi:hypothetical protein